MATESTTNATTIIARAAQHDIDLHKASDRANFGSIKEPIDAPYLLGAQTDSFDWLIGSDRWKKRVEEDEANGTNTVAHTSGLDEVFNEISPIENFAQTMSLPFSDPYFEAPRHTVQECKEKDYTYSAPLYVNAEFENGDTGEIKSQTVFMGDFSLQSPHGTFIIGGTERVIVSQLVRSPGVYFDRQQDRTSDKEVIGAKIIPSRGAWLEFEIDKKDQPQVRVDRKRKQSAIVFLMAIGMTKSELAQAFTDYPLVLAALEKETLETQDEAHDDLYRKIRPAATPTPEAGKNLLDSFYFNTKRYDLARVGRYKINRKLGVEADFNDRSLHQEDIIATIKYLVALHDGAATFPGKRNGEDVDLRLDVDDIYHFGNRRIRQVGELIQNQLRTGLSRMERVVRERMTTQDAEAITPQSLLNIRPVNATIKEFFGTSQLSQFMDQNNPLSGVTNKRRLSALGPGGLSRDRASMEVRDVHPSHFGRMCPIESPEGPNIGLIGSLATFGRVNPFGFIETPYRKVVNGHVTDEVEYMLADRDLDHVIAQANQELDENGNFVQKSALARVGEEEAVDVPVSSVDYMDVSPRQMVSLGASLIPFLEHDEGHRALMGTNMQRQAVPLIESARPLVGPGSEWRAANDSGDVIKSEKDGVVTYVSADLIRVMNDDGTTSSYKLAKFQRSNQTTCYNQRPIVHDGERVEAGSVMAAGPAIQNGDLALGKNLLIAFMPWNGYNYEDAVIISQRLVQDDTLSSIHIEEYEIDARETKLGAEEITRDLPNVGEDAVANLDERGIIRIGAEVEAGDILVGKVTPKGETELTPEERLLRAIFGEKSREVRDTSLRVPHGETGTVIGVKEITREDAEEDGDELPNGVNQMIRVYIAQHRKITVGDKLSGRHGNKGCISRILPEEDMPFLADGTPVDIMLNPLGVPSRMNIGQVLEIHLSLAAKALGFNIETPVFDGAKEIDIQDTLELANDYVNMPFDAEEAEDGEENFYDKYKDTLREDVMDYLSENRAHRSLWKGVPISRDGKVQLRDGRTGEYFDGKVTIGHMHYLKLHHLVDDKIHARSTGPYSLVTQQPLGGKAQFGGQRFGEMEVWALEAYGAAYTLQEILTVKSDDVVGRVKTYEAIIKGENIPEPGVPESFKVLLKELQSLGLDVKVLDEDRNEVELIETSEYGNTDINAIIGNDRDDRDYAFEDSESFEKHGFTKQEFDSENEELVNVEPENDNDDEDFGDADDLFDDAEEVLDDEE